MQAIDWSNPNGWIDGLGVSLIAVAGRYPAFQLHGFHAELRDKDERPILAEERLWQSYFH